MTPADHLTLAQAADRVSELAHAAMDRPGYDARLREAMQAMAAAMARVR